MDEPFGYLTFGGTFRRSLALLFDRFDLYMAITAVVMIPFVLIFASALVWFVWLLLDGHFYSPEDYIDGPLAFVVFGVESFVYALATVIGQGAITHAVTKVYIGEQPEWLACLKAAWKRKWSLFCACALVEGMIFLGILLMSVFVFVMDVFPTFVMFLLFILASIVTVVGVAYLYSGLLLVSPSIMTEGFSGPIKGIKRSWELSNGSRCYLICVLLSLGFCMLLVYAFLINMFGSGYIVSPVDIVVRIIPMTLYFPLRSIIQTVLYLNLRIGRESMNHEVLSGDLMANNASPESRFANSNPDAISHDSSIDYRHVPLMEDADNDMATTITSTV